MQWSTKSKGCPDRVGGIRYPVLRALALVVAATPVYSCGPRYTARSALGIDPACALIDPSPSFDSPVRFGVVHPVDPDHAPRPTNPSERAVFAHVYETLVAVDCRGRPRAALAQTWARHDGGERWTFTLRPDARFHDGHPVRARDVIASWRRAGIGLAGPAAVVDSVRALPDGSLDVYFARRQRSVPLVLARGVFAVARTNPDSPWPWGSGPWAVSSPVPLTLAPAFGASGPNITVVSARPRAARDFVDGAADVFTTGDPDVAGYARHRKNWTVRELPWSRVYVMVSPGRVRALRASRRAADLPRFVRDDLARDAVRVDSRGWADDAWWSASGSCAGSSFGFPGLTFVLEGAQRDDRIVLFDAADPVAADLAGRLTALSGDARTRAARALERSFPGMTGGMRPLIARGVAPTRLAASLWSGDEFAYILALPAAPADRCEALHDLLARVPWLSPPAVDTGRAVVALVETRRSLVVRRPGAGVVVDGHATALITNAWFGGDELP